MSRIHLRRWAVGTVAAVLAVGGGAVAAAAPAVAGTSTARYHCVPPAMSGKPAFDTDIPISLDGPTTAQPGQPITLTATIPDSGQSNPGPIALAGMKQAVDFSITGSPATATTIGSKTGSIPIGAPLPNPAMTATYTPSAPGTYTFTPTAYTLSVDTGIIGWLDTPCTLLTPPAPPALTIEVANNVPIPAAPANLQTTGKTHNSVSLSWTASAGATSYKVYNGDTLADTVTGTTATVTGLAPSTAYTFTVIASNSAGDSPPSAPVTATTDEPPVTKPNAPTGLQVTGTTTNTVSLSWTASPTAASYDVYNGSAIAVSVTGTSATVTGLAPNTSYTFTVVAKNSAGDSPPSIPVTATTSGGGGNIPFAFRVAGSTRIKAANGTVPLAGSITGTATTSGDITADLTISPASGSFKVFGFIPVTARVTFTQEGPTTGSIRDGVLITSTNLRVKVPSVKLFGFIPIGGGPSCQAISATTIELKSKAGFDPVTGGPLAGVYSLPGLTGCGALTPLISALFAGPGNTINVTLTPAS